MKVPYDHNIYLIMPDQSFVPIEISAISFGERGHISLRAANGQDYQIISLTSNLRQEFERVVANLTRRTVATVLDLSPEQVVMYFEASPVLREMADDVRAVLLGKKSAAAAATSDFDRDLARVSHLGETAKLADLSETIYGRRHYTGREHTHLQGLKNALKTSSSYGEEEADNENLHLRAA